MKYWSYLAAKFAIITGVFFLMGRMIALLWNHQVFEQQLPYTLAQLFTFLVVTGLVYLALWDQRYRCRTCLRRLRMPVAEGGWHRALFAPPRTDYICLYGHGTLRVPELKEVNHDAINWEEHDDIWKELFALHDSENAPR